MTSKVPLIVFTDLDGTLLDHSTYDWEAAKSTLQNLIKMGAIVVLASSKTGREITVLQNDMGLSEFPAIAENGAGIIGLSQQSPIADVYQDIRRTLDKISPHLRKQFVGFGDMTVSMVAEVTGLSLAAASDAKVRNFSEPGIWQGSEKERVEFISALNRIGIKAQLGGRFLTLSKGNTKADAMKRITEHFQPTHTIALGDAPNDIEMLEAADFGAIIANPHSLLLKTLQGENAGRIIRSDLSGPEGWAWAIKHLLAKLSFK